MWVSAEWCLCCRFVRFAATVAKESKERNKPENDLLYSFLWEIPPGSEFYVPTFRNILSHDKIQTPRASPQKEIIQYSQYGKSSISDYFLSSVRWTPLIRTNTLQIWWPWRHNAQLYYNPHVVLMALQNVLCLNVTVHLPASFLRLCVLLYSFLFLFTPIFFYFSFLTSRIFCPFCFLYSVSLIYFSVLFLLFFPAFLPWFCIYFPRLSRYNFTLFFVFAKYLPRFIKLVHNRTLTYNCTLA
jgi:hypothetical protein